MMHSSVAAFVLLEIMQHSCQETKTHNPLFNCIVFLLFFFSDSCANEVEHWIGQTFTVGRDNSFSHQFTSTKAITTSTLLFHLLVLCQMKTLGPRASD